MSRVPVDYKLLYKLVAQFDSLVGPEIYRLRSTLDGDALEVYEEIQECLKTIREKEKKS